MSGYNGWRNRRLSHRAKEDKKLTKEIRKIFEENRETHGSPRITHELRESGIRIGKNRVARLMRQGKMRAQNVRRSMPRTTDSNHKLPVAPNRIQQDFHVTGANQKWVSDITCIRVGSVWRYLCVILDLFNREVVGWSLAEHMRTELVREAYRNACVKRMPGRELIFHSDRGSQYASYEFRRLLEANFAIQSMSRKGNCYDNAWNHFSKH